MSEGMDGNTKAWDMLVLKGWGLDRGGRIRDMGKRETWTSAVRFGSTTWAKEECFLYVLGWAGIQIHDMISLGVSGFQRNNISHTTI